MKRLLKITSFFLIAILFILNPAMPSTKKPQPAQASPFDNLLERISMQRFNQLFQVNPDCISPCWWGHQLGEATGEEVYNTLAEAIGEEYFLLYDDWEGEFLVATTSTRNAFSIVVNTREGLFDGLELSFSHRIDHSIPNKHFNRYEPGTVMSAYGVPTRVLLYSSWLDEMALIYEEQRMIIYYVWRNTPITAHVTNIVCPDPEWLLSFDLYVFPPNTDLEQEEASLFGTGFDRFVREFEDATRLPMGDFVNIMQSNPKTCIQLEE